MTDRECLLTGLTISLFVHFALLKICQPQKPTLSAQCIRIALDMDTPAAVASASGGLGVESVTSQMSNDAKTADHKRQVFLAYLEAIASAIHARRLDGGDTGLIGVATCVFLINPNGTFSEPTLYISSGHTALDAAALRSVRAASGTVRRPAIIGTDPIHVKQEIKFQYDLK